MNGETAMKKAILVLILLPAILFSVHAQSTESIENRQIITPKTYEVTLTNLGEEVNSSDDDFSPLVLGNGRVIYFTTNRDGDQNIYSAISEGTAWKQTMNVGPSVNTDGNDGSACMTPDGHWMVFSACGREDGLGDCDLYIAEYAGGTWRNIKNLRAVNSPQWDSQPSISPDGTTLYFVSERPGGQGLGDVWMSKRSGDDWSMPVNLGTPVNTAGDEMSPFIAADNRTLYF